jgi:hypothetical protein
MKSGAVCRKLNFLVDRSGRSQVRIRRSEVIDLSVSTLTPAESDSEWLGATSWLVMFKIQLSDDLHTAGY